MRYFCGLFDLDFISSFFSLDLHVLLLDKLLVLLQRQDDKEEKYTLKSHNTTLSTGVSEMKVRLQISLFTVYL